MSTEFRDIVFQAARSLRQEESQDLVYLYKLPPSFNQSRPIEVLMQLEVLQMISESNPETLAIVLERVKRLDLAKDVRKWMKQSKKKKEKRTAIIPHDQTPTSQFLHAEVAITKMTIEHAVHRLHVLQEHIELWSSNCDVSPELKDAVQFCSLVTTKLSTIEKKLVPGRCFRRSSSSPSSSDEEQSPPSSFTSTIGCTRVESQLEQQLQQQQQVPHSPKTTREVHNRMCTNTSMRVPTPLVGLLPKAVVVEDHEDTGSGSDSGFSDVKQFLKPRQPPRAVFVTPQEETIDEGIYEKPPVDQLRYMKLRKEEVTTDEYATLGGTYVPTTDNCYEETQQQDDDNPYDEVHYTT